MPLLDYNWDEASKAIERVPKITTLVLALLLSLAAARSADAQTSGPNAEPCASTKETSNWSLYVNRAHSFCFRYPNVSKPAPLPVPDARSKRRPYEHRLLYLKRPGVDAEIMVVFNEQAFDLQNLTQIAAPTGNTFPPEPVQIGRNTFYYYGAGGGGAEYPDVYFFNLNGKTLEIYFVGPFPDGRNPSAETKNLEPKILSTFSKQ